MRTKNGFHAWTALCVASPLMTGLGFCHQRVAAQECALSVGVDGRLDNFAWRRPIGLDVLREGRPVDVRSEQLIGETLMPAGATIPEEYAREVRIVELRTNAQVFLTKGLIPFKVAIAAKGLCLGGEAAGGRTPDDVARLLRSLGVTDLERRTRADGREIVGYWVQEVTALYFFGDSGLDYVFFADRRAAEN